jgi:hypothetical protein
MLNDDDYDHGHDVDDSRSQTERLQQLAALLPPQLARRDWTDVGLCIACGYALRGLPQPRCPECGRWFDPCEPRTMNVPGWRPPMPPAPPPEPPTFAGRIIVAAGFATLLVAVFDLTGGAFGLLLWVGVLVAWRNRNRGMKRAKTRPLHMMKEGFAHWRLVLTVLFALTFAPWYWNDICPHAEYWGFGRIVIARSRTGGPCRNHAPTGAARFGKNWYIFIR